MKIKALRQHPRKDRVRILFEGDEEPRCELAVDLVLRAGLAPGDSIAPDQLEHWLREDQGYRARDAALNLLSHRARSTAELRRRLLTREFPPDVVDRTVAALADRGYLDDRAFAESFVRDRLRLRPRGRVGLVRELLRKGVDRDVADTAVDAVMGEQEVDDVALAADAAAAWARRNGPLIERAGRSPDERARARRRLYGHLARRGFAPDAVRAAIDGVFGD